ncbi:MAG: hypothetical protein H7252_07585, partial [Cytophaga sp.]|nr:hypothetical protein [Undibacterium sp.]
IGSGLGASTQPLEELDPEALLGNSLSEDMLESISIIDTASGLTDDAISTQDSINIKASDAESFDIGSLDFDLDIPNSGAADKFGSPLLPENLARVQKIIDEDPVVDFGTIDFQLNNNGITLDSLGTKIEDSSKVSVSTDQTNVNEIAFESASTSGMLINSASIEALPHLDSTDALDQQDVKLEAQIGAFEFDLSGINLDLNSKDVELELTPEEKQTYNAEMATKLDLAVAYHEIGDKEGARELLDEVLKGGTRDQIEKAKNMLIHLM